MRNTSVDSVSNFASPSVTKQLVYITITVVAVIGLLYIFYNVWRSYSMYSIVMNQQRGWSDNIFQSDPLLGISLRPNAKGAEILYGEHIPVNINEKGLRITAATRPTDTGNRKILFIGDSFTFGAGIHAEHIFPNEVARMLPAETMNGGVPGFGLAHMLVQTRKLLETSKPDIVVFQYSPWLSQRAMSVYTPSLSGALPAPYFSDNDDRLVLVKPAFDNKFIDRYRFDDISATPGPRAFIQLLSFTFPLLLHQDFTQLRIRAMKALGQIPDAAHDELKIIEHAYKEMARAALEAGAHPVILVIGGNFNFHVPYTHLPQEAVVVDAHEALVNALDEQTSIGYAKQYWQWKVVDNELILVDSHPNRSAHLIIANALLPALKDVLGESTELVADD